MNYLRTYIAQSCLSPGKKKPMKYDVVITVTQASKLQKVFIFLDIFLRKTVLLRTLRKLCMCDKVLFQSAISNNSINSKVTRQSPKFNKIVSWPGETIFLPKTRFLHTVWLYRIALFALQCMYYSSTIILSF